MRRVMQQMARPDDAGDRVPMRFAPALESAFRADFRRRREKMVRTGLVLAGVMYLLYFVLRLADPWDTMLAQTSALRLVITTAMLSLALLLPRIPSHRRERWIIVNYILFAVCLGGIQIIMLMHGDQARYEGMIFVAFHCFLISGLLFWRAFMVVCAMLAIYLLACWIGGLESRELGFRTFFLLLIPGLGGLAQNLVENRERDSWLRQRELERIAATDVATGLANRAAFEDHAQRMMQAARRAGDGLCLVIVDVDHFKAINDDYGHAAGDRVLEEVGMLLNNCGVAGTDLCARWGGDEFIALWQCCRTELLAQRFESLRSGLETVRPGNRPRARVTVSVGAVILDPEQQASLDDYLRMADEQLYLAKNAGRDAWRLRGSVEAA